MHVRDAFDGLLHCVRIASSCRNGILSRYNKSYVFIMHRIDMVIVRYHDDMRQAECVGVCAVI